MNLKNKLSLTYARSLMVTGAISESCREVEIEICNHISQDDNKIIVEFGMGQGNITREILKRMSPTSKLYAFEVKESFCNDAKRTILDDRLVIINDGAENLQKHIPGEINAVISSIPLSFFSKEKRSTIINGAYNLLEDNAYYSQLLYTKIHLKKFKRIFEDCYIKSHKNLFPEHVYHCKKTRL
tara:strand:- start:101105 stop:101656 length:552 start_codon:yes stop_codon:yes gene_type:complete